VNKIKGLISNILLFLFRNVSHYKQVLILSHLQLIRCKYFLGKRHIHTFTTDAVRPGESFTAYKHLKMVLPKDSANTPSLRMGKVS